jgi:phage terminase large subunit-like protein
MATRSVPVAKVEPHLTGEAAIDDAPFRLNAKQEEAVRLIGGHAQHVMLFGGSRSGKTFLIVRILVLRALAAPGSRHALLRLRFNHVKTSVILDTFPKVMQKCFPGVTYRMDKTDWYAEFPNGSQLWFGGLDDKERTEKILGQEYATIALNECSQIPYASRNLAVTRLAQRAKYWRDGEQHELRRKMLYDCNPPSQAHWTYQLFERGIDPVDKKPVDRARYASIQLNPVDNKENLPDDYLNTLDSLPSRMRLRFRDGKFADVTENALWTIEMLDVARETELPDMQRIVVAVDPSGSSDEDNAGHDPIGIIVAGLGVDGRGYVLEDLTINAGPKTWGEVATTAYDRHAADLIVAETNYGGDMVKFVVRTAKPDVPFKKVTASRGKAVRAEPISSLTERGKIRFAGTFNDLEDELCAFTTGGYLGASSPNRADAFVWAMTELFPGIAKTVRKEARARTTSGRAGGSSAWLGV